jgi:hypothetical protein
MAKKKIAISHVIIIGIFAAAAALIAYGVLVKGLFRPVQRAETVKAFPFSEENSLKEWEEKIFRGRVVYRIEQNRPLSYVRATSKGTASALYYKMKLDARRKNPVISWKWNVNKFPAKKGPERLETQSEGDFAAHVYVIFPALFFTNSKVLEYVWAESLPEGQIGTSPYSNNIKLIVARSGANKEGKWYKEERDIAADYKKAFGVNPEYDIGAVAFMTNAEHTGTSADAMYDDIDLGYKE